MTQDSASTKEYLLENDEYRKLDAQHHEFDDRLRMLTDKPILSDEEQLEETTLKKKKLQLKDRMEEIARQAVHP